MDVNRDSNVEQRVPQVSGGGAVNRKREGFSSALGAGLFKRQTEDLERTIEAQQLELTV